MLQAPSHTLPCNRCLFRRKALIISKLTWWVVFLSVFAQLNCTLLKECFLRTRSKLAVLLSFSDIHTNNFIISFLCGSADVQLYPQNIHTWLLVPMLICQTARFVPLPVCSSNLFALLLSHWLDRGWRRMLSRKTRRQADRQASPGKAATSCPAGYRPLRRLWRSAVFSCHYLGFYLCSY